jgi:hypothetical protein
LEPEFRTVVVDSHVFSPGEKKEKQVW